MLREDIVKHMANVGYISYMFGGDIELTKKEQIDLLYGGNYHDIGKFSIDKNILYKKGKLSRDEFSKVSDHPIIGYKQLKETGIISTVPTIVIQHHEREDGSGYPFGLKSNEINKLTKIVSLADSYDAMTSKRSYSKVMSHSEAIIEIGNSLGTQFNEELGEKFIKFLEKVNSKEELLTIA